MEEIEAKFFIINKETIRSSLSALGAQKTKDEFLMKRYVYDNPLAPKGDWIRIRQESDRVVLTFKSKKSHAIDGMLETEVTVSDFEKRAYILSQTGLHVVAYQENYREVWNWRDVEIVVDTWPWLPPYIEIEGPNKSSVEQAAQDLGFVMEEAYFGTAYDLYASIYKVTNEEFHSIKRVSFDEPMPEILSTRRIAKS